MNPRRARRGVVLLEIIVALVILVTAGIAAVTLASQSAQTVERARAAERRTQSASALLDVMTLWPREDLDRHIGYRRQGEWVAYVDRPSPSLYRIAIYDSTRHDVILETAVFRDVPFQAQ